MISLRLTGGVELGTDRPSDAESLLSQPKRVALLACLLLNARSGWIRRDTLVAMLWPEVDQERARNSLRQGLHQLRRLLGADTIVSRGTEELGVAPGTISCDAVEFLALIEKKEWAQALATYKGELLPGFHVSDAPDFEQWLDGERTRLHALAIRATATLTEREESAGNLTAAVEWAERGLELAPSDESRAEALIRLRERTGDRVGALLAFESFAARLEREFGIKPSAALVRRVEEVRRPRPQITDPQITQIAQSPAAAAMTADPSAHSVQSADASVDRRRRFPFLYGAVAAAVVLAVVALIYRRVAPSSAVGSTPTADLVIWPFRVAGADPALGYLREGMVDLLSARLTGEAGGLRATDPRTVINAWHQATGDTLDPGPKESVRLARGLGAGRALLGSVVGRASRLVLQAASYDVASGAVRARGTAEGPVDSLPELVDQLAAQLLAEESGGSAPAGPALHGTPLPAVQAYLEGSQAYRSGRYQQAYERFLAAVAADSTFGPAAVGLASAAIWYPTAEAERQRGLRLAWAVRDRLGQADRALLMAMAGPRYPELSSYRERFGAWEQATAIAPGRPEAWYEYGDILMHRGPLLGIAGSADLAQRAFARAVALDSSFAPPLGHLFELAAQQGDTLAMAATSALFLARDSASDLAEYVRWRRSVVGNDPRLAALVRRRLPIMPVASLSRIIGASQLDGLLLDQALLAARVLESRPLKRDDQVDTGMYLMEFALNRGHPTEAARLADLLANNAPGEDAQLAAHILNALYADGDESAGRRTAARFRVYLATSPPAKGEPRALHLWKSCAAAQWNAWHGDTTGVSATIAALRRREGAELPWWAPANEELCATLLDALLTVTTGRPDARTRVLRLDSLTLTAPDVDVRDPATLALARLWSRLGEPARALDAVRRRQNHFRTGLPFLATRLREEVGYALAAGDTAGATEARRRFRILYADPEPERLRLRDPLP